MPTLTEEQVLLALLAVAVILLAARAAGEIARRVGQPEVLGELLAGFVLGPSVLGALLPGVHDQLFMQKPIALVLSGMSWVGAILLLLVAGMEVDLSILRKETRPGALAAAGAIVPSLIAGSLFAALLLGKAPPDGVFLGIVLSVTAVSVASKILIERDAMRRRYAQVILAAGIASEVLVWLQISVVSALHGSDPVLAGLRSTGFAIAFFVLMMTVGRRFTFWAMRRVRDAAQLTEGPISLVLVLTFLCAAATQALGLHAVLGAFVFGVLLAGAPRVNEELSGKIGTLTLGLFGPIFFALAGMRVDILGLGSVSSVATIAALFVVASVVKVGLGTLGARLGGRSLPESALIGVGLNLKGGTDVIVAVIGTELGLLSTKAYSMYAVVAILTVLVSPPIVTWLEKKAPPSEEERERLEREAAMRRSYLSRVERVLVPVEPRLLPDLAASVLQPIAASKHEQGQLLDIVQFDVGKRESREPVAAGTVRDTQGRLDDAGALGKVEVTQRRVDVEDEVGSILEESRDYDLIAIGARPPGPDEEMSLGPLADEISHRAQADVLLVIDHSVDRVERDAVHRVLVPTNGIGYSLAAGDLAGAIAAAWGAEVTLLTVVRSHVEEGSGKERDRRKLEHTARSMLDDLAFRLRPLGVEVRREVVTEEDPAEAIVGRLKEGDYDLVVLGGINRGMGDHPYAGKTIRRVVTAGSVPSVVLVSRPAQGG